MLNLNSKCYLNALHKLTDAYYKSIGINDYENKSDTYLDALYELAKSIEEVNTANSSGTGETLSEIKSEISSIKSSFINKVDKVEGKSLVDDKEINRLATLVNYDDTEVKSLIENKVDSTDFQELKSAFESLMKDSPEAYNTLVEIANYFTQHNDEYKALIDVISNKVDKVEGKSLVDDKEINRLATLVNYDDTDIKTSIENKVDKVEGKSLVDDKEIERLAKVYNYNDTDIKKAISEMVSYDKETVKTDLVTDKFIDDKLEPYYDEASHKFFANGYPIKINQGETDSQVVITWGIIGKAVIENSSKLDVHGGADCSVIAKNIPQTKIIMNGGTLKNIWGGNDLSGVVGKSEIIMNGGTVTAIMGGGRAQVGAKVATTVVYNSNVIINDGTTKSTVYGGGLGSNGLTDNVNIIINGGSHNWVTAGGSHGVVSGEMYVNINGGSINVYQSTNRGTTEDCNIEVTGGSINNFYCGGETAQDVTGTVGNVNVEVTGGSITNFKAGTDGSIIDEITKEYTEVLLDPSKVTGTYVDGVITNFDETLTGMIKQ